MLNYLSHTYGLEFPLPIWPLCASHQRWKQLFCHSSSQWLAPKLGKKVFLPKRSEKDLFLPFPNIYLKLIHVQSCYLLPCMNIMVASRCLFLYFCWKNVVFFSISAGNNVVFAPFTKHNIKYSLNSGYYLYSWHVLVRIACPKKDDTVLFLSGAFLLCNQLIKAAHGELHVENTENFLYRFICNMSMRRPVEHKLLENYLNSEVFKGYIIPTFYLDPTHFSRLLAIFWILPSTHATVSPQTWLI